MVVRPEEWTQPKSTTAEQPDIGQTPNEVTGIEQAAAEWPLLEYIDIADSLRSGIAIVLLYHYDCPDCREAIPLYEQMNRDLADNYETVKIAFIEVPPYGLAAEDPVGAETACLKGKLDASKKWYFTTPLV
ncbi:unnamed protein product, partial [marine sediment metagenome]